jgi:thiamine biosynthesis protein ThiC
LLIIISNNCIYGVIMTQLELARQKIITKEMKIVAKKEKVAPE